MGGGLGRVNAGALWLSEICSTGPAAAMDSATVKSSLNVEGTLRALRLALWWGARYSSTATVLSGNTCRSQILSVEDAQMPDSLRFAMKVPGSVRRRCTTAGQIPVKL